MYLVLDDLYIYEGSPLSVYKIGVELEFCSYSISQ